MACFSPLHSVLQSQWPYKKSVIWVSGLFLSNFQHKSVGYKLKRKINYECHISNQAPLQRSGERRPPFSLRLWASLRCQVVSWITRISPGFGRFDTFMWQDIYQQNRNKSSFINCKKTHQLNTYWTHSAISRWNMNLMLEIFWLFPVWDDGQWYKREGSVGCWSGSKLSIYLMSRSPSVRHCLLYYNIT